MIELTHVYQLQTYHHPHHSKPVFAKIALQIDLIYILSFGEGTGGLSYILYQCGVSMDHGLHQYVFIVPPRMQEKNLYMFSSAITEIMQCSQRL